MVAVMNHMMAVAMMDRRLGRSDGDRDGGDGGDDEAKEQLAHDALNDWVVAARWSP
jgi:hypothetical protein